MTEAEQLDQLMAQLFEQVRTTLAQERGLEPYQVEWDTTFAQLNLTGSSLRSFLSIFDDVSHRKAGVSVYAIEPEHTLGQLMTFLRAHTPLE